VKVTNLFCSNITRRGVAAAVIVLTLLAGGSAAPFAAQAETVSSTATSVVSIETSVTTSAVGVAATPTVAIPVLAKPAATAAVATKLTVPALIGKIGRESRLPKSEIAALLWIAKHESNFHPTSASRSGCYGLFQLSKAIARGHKWQDPTWNTRRAIKYMKGRYGGVLQAKAFWSNHHWY
jgi:hypothetical protein